MATMFHRCVLAWILPLGFVPAAVAEHRIASFATSGATGVQVNPVTNRSYVATSSSLAVIDGATQTLSLMGVAGGIFGIAVDPVRNRIFSSRINVVERVDVFDGVTHAMLASIPVPRPRSIALNPVTGDAYVISDGSVVAIDGATLATTTVSPGSSTYSVAVNPVTNKVYINGDSHPLGGVFMVDGVTKARTLVLPGVFGTVAVNPVTNKVYVRSRDNVTVLDGATGATITIPVAGSCGIAVNPATNKVYVANQGPDFGTGGDVTVIDGATNATTTVGAGTVHRPCDFVVNPVTNTIYADSQVSGSTDVVVIDGSTNAVRVFQAAPPTASGIQTGMAVNPVTNMLYVTRFSGITDVVDASTYTRTVLPIGSAGMPATSPTTDKLYIPVPAGNTVKVLDEPSGAVTDVTVGTNPAAVAVNLVTNRIYVANRGSDDVSVIDGATNAVTTTIPAGDEPVAVAVNPVTNKAYVANRLGNSVTVLDGATNGTVTVAAGSMPSHVVVNEAANRIYVLNANSNDVTVIDGRSNARSTVAVGTTPLGIAVNAVTDKVYVSNFGSHSVTVIDGATNATATVPVGAPRAIAVDTAHNRIYVASFFGHSPGSVTVIDGATLATASLPIVGPTGGFAVDSVAGKVYVGTVAGIVVIDTSNHAFSDYLPGDEPIAFAVVNPASNRVYMRGTSGNLSLIRPFVQALGNHDIDVAAGHITSSATPALSASVCCPYSPSDPPAQAVYFRAGNSRGLFTRASGTSPFEARPTGLIPGLNFVTLFAADALAGSSFQQRSSVIGAPRVLPLVYTPPSPFVMPPLAPVVAGDSLNQALPTNGGAGPFTFAIIDGALPAGVTLSAGGVLSGTPTEAGFFVFTVAVTDANQTTSAAVLTLAVLGSNPPRLGNISTRAQSLGGNEVLIGGFVIGGSTNKTIVVRARGPSLVPFGIANALSNPTLQLVRSADQSTVASNDDWGTAGNAAVVAGSGYAPSNALESAILVNLAPGAYTAIVSGANGGTGVAIVEVFELDHPESPLANISTRGQVLTGNDVMIGGFVVQGTGPQTVVVRARGPSLVPFGIQNALGNPHLQLVRSADQSVVAINDNWVNAPNRQAIEASGFAPSNILESAILMTLDPGAYTAIVSGVGGTTGVGIVEVFTLP